MWGKRLLAVLLSALMLWPSTGIALAESDFAPADPPQNMYAVLQPVMGRRQISYRNGYRTGTEVIYTARTRQTPVENLALYMNVYIDNAEGDVQELLNKANYRQIDIQRYIDGFYYEVRWSFNQLSLQRGWNRLLLRFDTAKDMEFHPLDERMQSIPANRQTVKFEESASFNFALSYLDEEGACSQYTIILDDVAIVDLGNPVVNAATPAAPSYRLVQDLRDSVPDQELAMTEGGFQLTSDAITPSSAWQHAAADHLALYMNVYIDNRLLPYHTGALSDKTATRRLALSDDSGGEIVWENGFNEQSIRPGWNTLVWRLSTGDSVWDGAASDYTSADGLSLDGTLRLSLSLTNLGDAAEGYRLQIAQVALVDASRRADGTTYYDTTYDVLSFSAAETTYTAENQTLTTGWVQADNTTADTGVDVSRHNLSGLRLLMTMRLDTAGEWSADALSQGTIRLRSVDSATGDTAAAWSVRGLKLKKGDNLLSLAWSDLMEMSGAEPLDATAVNRLMVELPGAAMADQPVSMTLSNVKLVDVAGRQPGKAAVVTPADGAAGDTVVYNLNAAEWGADPTGEVDSTTAIQDCLDTLRTDGGVVYLPAGQYQLRGTLSIPAGVTLRGVWQNPNEGGSGRGTILMAHAGAEDETGTALIRLKSSACLRDISVWYPEQDPTDPVPYPPTIEGQGHTVVKEVTLYNTYIGFYNNSCSSMLIRDFYATALKQGIYGANAYDIPRIERVSVDTRYWMNSGLPGAPTGLAADQLNSHTRQTTVGLIGGRQDWGYWYDIEIANAKTGIFLFAGNDAVGKLVTRNVQYGIYTTNVNAPGLQITHSDISASVEGVHYEVDGLQTLVATATTFRDAPIGIHTLSKTSHGVSLTDCTFRNWDRYALYMEGGHLTTDDNRFEDDKPAIKLEATVSQALLSGNTFAAPETALTAADTTLVQRDDTAKVAPCVPDYTFTPAETRSAATDRLFLVTDYGAQAGGVRDCTAAFQEALTAAGEAGGGTVYIPGGTYRLNGSLTVPSGVELRGSFDGAHYGNSTFNGTHLYVYGGKNDQTAAPLITLAKNAGAKGFTVFYPEQGFTDQTEGVEEAEQIKTYPYTLRADAGCWLENLAIVGAYDGIDAITNRCDGLVVRDVTGCVLHDTIQVGHGMRGGTLHNLHLNPSGWSQQGNYENSPTGKLPDGVTKRSDLFDDYETREATYLTLGDCRDLQIFSCFNIVIATQLRLIADPYTGGSFEGVTWGVAFDASRDGVVGEDGCAASLTMHASMGVFNQQGGGYNVITKPGFTGEITLFNADAWGGNSRIALVEGGRVTFSQYLSMSVYQGECHGGELNMYTSVLTSRSGDNSGHTPDLTYFEKGRGTVWTSLDCVEKFNVNVHPGAQVREGLNGYRLTPSVAAVTFAGTDGEWAATEQGADTDWQAGSNRSPFVLANRNRQNLRLWLTATVTEPTTLHITLGDRDEEGGVAGWTVTLSPGENRLSLPVEQLQQEDPDHELTRVTRLRVQADAAAPVVLSAAQLTDLTTLYQQKQQLYTGWLATPEDTAGCLADTVAAYEAALEAARAVYADERADEAALQAAQQSVQQAALALSFAQGDVNGDTEITIVDALMTLQAAAGQIELSARAARAAAVTDDGVSAAAALAILQYTTHQHMVW